MRVRCTCLQNMKIAWAWTKVKVTKCQYMFVHYHYSDLLDTTLLWSWCDFNFGHGECLLTQPRWRTPVVITAVADGDVDASVDPTHPIIALLRWILAHCRALEEPVYGYCEGTLLINVIYGGWHCHAEEWRYSSSLIVWRVIDELCCNTTGPLNSSVF